MIQRFGKIVLVSVIIPAYNASRFLRQTLESVVRQTHRDLEIIVVDDGSTDNTVRIVEGIQKQDPRVALYRQVNQGAAVARNLGIEKSKGNFIAFLDADDLWPPGTLHRLREALDSEPEALFAQGLIQNFRQRADGSMHLFTHPYRFLNLGASLYRRSLFASVGLLDPTMRLCEDLDFLMRCWEKNVKRAVVEEVTLYYRRHPNGMTAGLQGAGFGTVQAFKRRIERIRRGIYDPSQPRDVPANEYMGAGPVSQDQETIP